MYVHVNIDLPKNIKQINKNNLECATTATITTTKAAKQQRSIRLDKAMTNILKNRSCSKDHYKNKHKQKSVHIIHEKYK